MSFYLTVLFLHIASSIGLFVAIAFDALVLIKLQKAATSEQFQTWRNSRMLPMKVGPPSLAVSVLSGVYLATGTWGDAPWIWVSIGAILLIAVTGASLNAPAQQTFETALMPKDMEKLWSRLWFSLQIRLGLLIGILYVMVVKTELGASLIALVASVLLFTAPVPFLRKKYQAFRLQSV